MTPKTAATHPPANRAGKKLIFAAVAKIPAVYAPMAMKAACPKWSWPVNPVTKLSPSTRMMLMPTVTKIP